MANVPSSRAGTVAGPSSNSYYTIGGFTLGNYTVSISNLLRDADLFVYPNSTFSTTICQSELDSTATDSCNINCPTSTCNDVYIRILGFDTGGTSFTLSVQ